MTEKKYKIPMVFDYILTAILFAMFFAVFLGIEFFAITQFLGILVMFIFYMLDKKYGEELCDHKITHFLFNIITLISLIALLGFEIENYSITLSALIIVDIIVVSILVLLDISYVDDGFFDKFWCNIINTTKLCSMICICTYYNGAISIIFAILIIVLSLANVFAVVYATILTSKKKKLQAEVINEVNNNNETDEVLTINQIEDIIYRQGE